MMEKNIEIRNGVRRTITHVRRNNKIWRRIEVRRQNRFAPTEVIESEPWFKPNPDIRPPQAYVDQGLVHEPEPLRFGFDRMLCEDCVQIGNRVYAFHKTTKADFEPGFWLRPEWIKEHLKLNWKQTIRLAEAWQALKFNRRTALQIMFGVKNMKTGQVYQEGLKDLAEDGEDLTAIIDYYEVLADQLPELERIPEETGNAQYQTFAEGNHAVGFSEKEDDNKEPDEWDELASEIRGSLTERLHPMFTGNESCRHEFLESIRTMTRGQIKRLMRNFFPQRDEATGRWTPAKYWNLTPSQKAQAWEAINARRDELGMWR